MAPTISVREFIRWPPASAAEPTSTVVLTSAEARYVDLRIFLPNAASSRRGGRRGRGSRGSTRGGGNAANAERQIDNDVLPFARLDWAFAGTSDSHAVPIVDPNRNGNLYSGSWGGGGGGGGDGGGIIRYHPFTRAKWNHWIDSRTLEPEKVVDEAYMYPAHDGSTLEKGRMVNPATGQVAEYEEKWLDVEPMSTFDSKSWSGKRRYDDSHDDDTVAGTRELVVLVLHEEAHRARGVVIRVGHYCQGFVRVGEHMSLERWVWEESGVGEGEQAKKSWRRKARMGDLFVPCGPAMEMKGPSGGRLELGGTVTYGEYSWKLVELARF